MSRPILMIDSQSGSDIEIVSRTNQIVSEKHHDCSNNSHIRRTTNNHIRCTSTVVTVVIGIANLPLVHLLPRATKTNVVQMITTDIMILTPTMQNLVQTKRTKNPRVPRDRGVEVGIVSRIVFVVDLLTTMLLAFLAFPCFFDCERLNDNKSKQNRRSHNIYLKSL